MSALPKAEITIHCVPAGTKGAFQVVATIPGDGSVVDTIRLAVAKDREAFADRVCDGRPGISREDVLASLAARAADEVLSESPEAQRSQAADLIQLVLDTQGLELFHTPNGEAWATVPSGSQHDHLKVTSGAFKRWLQHRYYTARAKPAGTQPLQDALGVLSAKAAYEGPERSVHIRVAEHGGCVWVDLCDDERNAVRVDASGWRVVGSAEVPVKFFRGPAMRSLPVPEPGGSVDEIRPLVNMPDDDDFVLFIGWIIGTFNPGGPYGILSVSGEHGSAKSTVCMFAVRMTDPRVPELRRPPRNEQDLFVAGKGCHVLALNNVSGIRADLSDALCTLATDGGFATRTFYVNDEETIFTERVAVIVNGIDEPASRPDLVDRCISITLRSIPDSERREEREVLADFRRVLPRVLGALLTAVSSALRNRDRVELKGRPRMADLAVWVTAAEEGLGWRSGRFMDAYTGNRTAAQSDAVEASVVGTALLALLADGPFQGTAQELLDALNRQRSTEHVPQEWPKSARGMGEAVRRLAPSLRVMGVEVDLPEKRTGRQKRRVLMLGAHGPQQAAQVHRGPVNVTEIPYGPGEDVLDPFAAAHAAHAAHPPQVSKATDAEVQP